LCRLGDHESLAAPAVQSKGRHNREVGTIGGRVPVYERKGYAVGHGVSWRI